MNRVVKPLLLVACLAPVWASAQLDPYVLSGGTGGNLLTGPGTVTYSGVTGLDNTQSAASAAISPFPLISVTANAESTFGAEYGGAAVNLNYCLAVSGPAGVVVPILFSANANVGGAGNANTSVWSYATLSVETNDPNQAKISYKDQVALNLTSVGPTASNFVPLTGITAYADTATGLNPGSITVQMSVYTQPVASGNGVSNSCSGSASLDPYFYVDPSFANAAAYTITASPGVGNSPAPEPCSFLALSLGVCALPAKSFLKRRRSR